MPRKESDRLTKEIREALMKISVLPARAKVPRDLEIQAKTLKSLLSVARETMKSDDPTVDKKRLAAFIQFLEAETKKDHPSEDALRDYLKRESGIFNDESD